MNILVIYSAEPKYDDCPFRQDLNCNLKSSVLNNNAKRTAAAKLTMHKQRAKNSTLNLIMLLS